MRGEPVQSHDRGMAELQERIPTEVFDNYVIYMERQNRIFRQ